MFGRIALAALIAGLVGGIVVTLFQLVQVIPLIHEAEVYEAAAAGGSEAEAGMTDTIAGTRQENDHADHDHQAHDHGAHDHGSWAPRDGLQRLAFTVLANVMIGIGFALILCAVAVLLLGSISWRAGILWGLAGFAAFALAPALGLPPELPGMVGGDVYDRQIWWALTAAATAGGLGLIAYAPLTALKVAGGILIIIPHAIGAPDGPYGAAGAVPAELAAAFVSASLMSNLILWIALGAVSGYMLQRQSRA